MQAHSRPPLFEEIDRCRGWIESALEHANGSHDWYDIAAGIMDGRYQLWPAENSALVTEIITFPRKRVINIFLGGGKLTELAGMHEDVIAWAKKQGCTSATISGREGWKRAFKRYGWKPLYITLEKEFD